MLQHVQPMLLSISQIPKTFIPTTGNFSRFHFQLYESVDLFWRVYSTPFYSLHRHRQMMQFYEDVSHYLGQILACIPLIIRRIYLLPF